MNMGSLKTELDAPMGMGLRGDSHNDHNIEFDEDIMMLGSTPKVCLCLGCYCCMVLPHSRMQTASVTLPI